MSLTSLGPYLSDGLPNSRRWSKKDIDSEETCSVSPASAPRWRRIVSSPMHSPSPPKALHSLHEFQKNINHAELNAVGRATYFVLEPRIEWGDNIAVASIEDAEDAGFFCIHVGLPERPDMRSVFTCPELADTVKVLSALKIEYPDVPLWFCSWDLQAEIRGSDVWRGLVAARASHAPTDANCPWVQLAADFEAGKITRISYGDDHRAHWLHFFIAAQIGKPITVMPYRDHSGI